MRSYPVAKFACGHVGRSNEGGKVKDFIRVAEIRDSRVDEVDKNCPNCGGR